jgi:hypothetical protein
MQFIVEGIRSTTVELMLLSPLSFYNTYLTANMAATLPAVQRVIYIKNTDDADISLTVTCCEISGRTRHQSDGCKRQNDRVSDYALTYGIICSPLPPNLNYRYCIFHCNVFFRLFACTIRHWYFRSGFMENNNPLTRNALLRQVHDW